MHFFEQLWALPLLCWKAGMLWRPRYTPAAKCHEWTRLIAGFVGVKGEALRHVREAAGLLEDAGGCC